jgi:glutamyl-tRNA reductase
MFCKYITYKDCDSRQLACIKADYISLIKPHNTVVISTCHRIEFYSKDSFDLPEPPKELAGSWNTLEGIENILIRLATIACGADSKILGESFIAFQSVRPFLKTSVSNLPFELIDKSFEIAQRVKEIYDFKTKFSYDDAAFQLINNEKINRPKHLIIIGGGLLGQHMAKHKKAAEYRSITIITKQVKRCKIDISLSENSDLIKVVSLNDLVVPSSFDLLIATNIDDTNYDSQVKKLIENRKDGSTVDFCAIPLLANKNLSTFNYYTMYDNSFLSLVEEANSHLINIKPKLIENIKFMVDLLINYQHHG